MECPNAEKRPRQRHQRAEPPHPCPYAQDIDNDDETLCTCCDICQSECALDI